MRITGPPAFKTSDISKGVQGTLMDIEGVPKLFIALYMCYHASEDRGHPTPQVPSSWTGQSTDNGFEKP